jgi:hypothetical protein
MMTAFGDEAIVMISVVGMAVAHEIGITTGEDHVLGTATVAGTKTKLEVATVTTNELGTVITMLDGTDDGKFDEAMIAIDGDEAITTNEVCGNEEMAEYGTTNGLDQVDGTVMEFGTET